MHWGELMNVYLFYQIKTSFDKICIEKVIDIGLSLG